MAGITDAATDVGGVPSNIKYTCEGKFKTAYGYRWSYDKTRCDMRSLERKKHYHTDVKKRAMSEQFKGTVVAVDTKGNKQRIPKTDVRLKSGELVLFRSPNQQKKLNEQHKCPHCGCSTNIGNYKRWHGPNCKHRKSKT